MGFAFFLALGRLYSTVLHKFWCRGDGGGGWVGPSNKKARFLGIGPSLLLIMSVAYKGVILCKLSEDGFGYERTMD